MRSHFSSFLQFVVFSLFFSACGERSMPGTALQGGCDLEACRQEVPRQVSATAPTESGTTSGRCDSSCFLNGVWRDDDPVHCPNNVDTDRDGVLDRDDVCCSDQNAFVGCLDDRDCARATEELGRCLSFAGASKRCERQPTVLFDEESRFVCRNPIGEFEESLDAGAPDEPIESDAGLIVVIKVFEVLTVVWSGLGDAGAAERLNTYDAGVFDAGQDDSGL